MDSDREFFSVFWGIMAVVGVVALKLYRDKELQEIFDKKHDLFDF